MNKAASRDKVTTELQECLQQTIVLLLELKAKPSMSRTDKREIDDAVAKLQEVIRDLPTITKSRNSFQAVFAAIRRAIEVWRKLFPKPG